MGFILLLCFFFFQAEDGIRDAQESRGLGDVYKRQVCVCVCVCVYDSRFAQAWLSFDFTNINGLHSNSASMEYYLSNSKPNFMLLSETQMAKNSSFNSFNISNYNLFYNFRLKGGVCAYVNKNIPITRLENLESPNFNVLWLKIFLPSTTTFLCFCYCSPNRTDFHSFFDYLTTSHETVISSHLNTEVLYLGDFNVHNTESVSYTHLRAHETPEHLVCRLLLEKKKKKIKKKSIKMLL